MRQPVSAAVLEAIFLEALGTHSGQDDLTAVRAGVYLREVRPTLKGLAALSRTDSAGHAAQRPAQERPPATGTAQPAIRTRGRKPQPKTLPTESEMRLLALLDRPRRVSELAVSLGLTRQRIHQLIVMLLDRDLVRIADPLGPISVVARKQDPSILLPLEQERMLNRFQDTGSTTITGIVRVCHWRVAEIAALLQSLRDAGLIEQAGSTPQGNLYRLTAAGVAHWQRSVTARRADAPSPPLPFRSDRVRTVLGYLAQRGAIRTRDIGRGLEIPPQSMNALMQYLKRKGMVRPQSDAHNAPYMLTAEGRATLTSMLDKAAA